MQNIRNLKQKLKEDFSETPDLIQIPVAKTKVPIQVTYYPQSLCEYHRLNFLDLKFKDYLYFYNACLLENNRLFFRCGKEPKGFEDRIGTLLLDSNLKVIRETIKLINVHSRWEESATTNILKTMLPYVFKDGEHVEDPRAIMFKGNYFVFYTDGLTIGVAKLDLDCNTVYSHYLKTPNVTFKNSDGREKNWIPFIYEDSIHILYGTDPLVYFKLKDTGTKLEYDILYNLAKTITWNYGYIRGGAPPCEYTKNSLLWCFHSTKIFDSHVKSKAIHYMFGVYVTENKFPFDLIKFCRLPLLIGIASHASETLSLQHHVVYPCGVIKTKQGWRISMGINDYKIAFLDITEKDFLW
jgi:hypothetical protein